MLRSIVGPLEDEIKSLKDQLQQARLDQVTCSVDYTDFNAALRVTSH